MSVNFDQKEMWHFPGNSEIERRLLSSIYDF